MEIRAATRRRLNQTIKSVFVCIVNVIFSSSFFILDRTRRFSIANNYLRFVVSAIKSEAANFINENCNRSLLVVARIIRKAASNVFIIVIRTIQDANSSIGTYIKYA